MHVPSVRPLDCGGVVRAEAGGPLHHERVGGVADDRGDAGSERAVLRVLRLGLNQAQLGAHVVVGHQQVGHVDARLRAGGAVRRARGVSLDAVDREVLPSLREPQVRARCVALEVSIAPRTGVALPPPDDAVLVVVGEIAGELQHGRPLEKGAARGDPSSANNETGSIRSS